MPKLYGIGFFISSLRDPDLPAPQELVGHDSRLSLVADYLDAGLVHTRYRGYSWCRLCDIEYSEMGSADLTDGIWIWPEGLSHYLRHHSVLLPEPFLSHALAAPTQSMPPDDATTDIELWLEWSRPRRISRLRESLLAAQSEDDRLAEAARSERIAANEAKHGIGDGVCIRAGCGRPHLTGKVFCSHHLPEMSIDSTFHVHSHRLLKEALRCTS